MNYPYNSSTYRALVQRVAVGSPVEVVGYTVQAVYSTNPCDPRYQMTDPWGVVYHYPTVQALAADLFALVGEQAIAEVCPDTDATTRHAYGELERWLRVAADALSPVAWRAATQQVTFWREQLARMQQVPHE